jgi:hypothetical protein
MIAGVSLIAKSIANHPQKSTVAQAAQFTGYVTKLTAPPHFPQPLAESFPCSFASG